MNTKNNRLKRHSKEKIEKAFVELLQDKELGQIAVSDICKLAELNRSTFYANYIDIYDLADSVRKTLEGSLDELYRDEISLGYNSNNFLRLFQHIYGNQLFYQIYFKLGYDNDYKILRYDTELAKKHFDNEFIEYHTEFFKGGITTIIKIWLHGGCRETPEQMQGIIISEYAGRAK